MCSARWVMRGSWTGVEGQAPCFRVASRVTEAGRHSTGRVWCLSTTSGDDEMPVGAVVGGVGQRRRRGCEARDWWFRLRLSSVGKSRSIEGCGRAKGSLMMCVVVSVEGGTVHSIQEENQVQVQRERLRKGLAVRPVSFKRFPRGWPFSPRTLPSSRFAKLDVWTGPQLPEWRSQLDHWQVPFPLRPTGHWHWQPPAQVQVPVQAQASRFGALFSQSVPCLHMKSWCSTPLIAVVATSNYVDMGTGGGMEHCAARSTDKLSSFCSWLQRPDIPIDTPEDPP